MRDYARITDATKRSARVALFQRYALLQAPPEISLEQELALGRVDPDSNNGVDQELLAAIRGNAAEYLVSEDQGLHARARQLGVSERVITVADAVAMLHALHADLPNPPPSVHRIRTHQLNLRDPLFDGLKADYPGFAQWFEKASRAQRPALLIDGHGEHAAIAILKREPEGSFGLAGPLLKICTFKVADGYSGQKYGELLLKAIFQQAHVENDAGLYLTVYEKHEQLLELIEDFGFLRLPELSRQGELVYTKAHGGNPPADLDPFSYHVRYGPPALDLRASRIFLVPIEPRWHRVLFPDAEPADNALFPATEGLTIQPFGNAIRKAYLCNSPSRLLRRGDVLLFYRSGDEKAVFVVGVCENVMVSSNAEHIAATVGRRTVYSVDDIAALAKRSEVLVLQFRQDRILTEPIDLEELVAAQVVRSWPQSITRSRGEGAEWLAQRLDG